MKKSKITTLTLITLICVMLLSCLLIGCNANGNFTYGTGTPSNETGNNGDYYLDTDSNALYQKTNGVWQILSSGDYRNTQILLPDTLFACVGQQIEIYFTNILMLSQNDVFIRTATDMPDCRQLQDKWTGTPQKAGVYALVISVYDKNWQFISSKRISISVKDSSVTKPVTALVIGDSTIYSGAETFKLLDLSRRDDFNLTLLGTMDRGDGNYCEGRSGWRASHYTSCAEIDGVSNPFYNPNTETFDFDYYMTTQNYVKADVVFIQLGINDIFHSMEDTLDEAVNLFITSMQTMVNSIRLYDKNTNVVINLVIPCCQDQTKFGQVYGVKTVWEYMRNMYRANIALLNAFQNDEKTFISFANAALDLDKNQTNDVHPAVEGYYQMATQMYYMMKNLVG